MRRPKFHTVLKFSLFLMIVIVGTLILLSKLTGSEQQSNAHYRSLWRLRGISNYQIRVVTVALPVPPVALDLTIEDSKIIDKSIVSCDNPTEKYPQRDCETITQYYSNVGEYTIEQLFDVADDCICRTRDLLANCPTFTIESFQSFSNVDEMLNTAESCKTYLPSLASLCAVEYDPYYGFPRSISRYAPAATDGGRTIIVEQFQVIE